jgi:predicted nucleic acid-binding protein
MDFVVDASVAMAWLLQSQSSPLTVAAESALADNTGWVPGHFGIEVARSLRNHERRGSITAAAVDEALAHLIGLKLKQDTDEALGSLEALVSLARRHRLRVADAAYLDLAMRLELPLATRDAALARAAKNAGVQLFTSENAQG